MVLIYTQVQYLRSSNFDPTYPSTAGGYDKGYFSLETWTCETPRYISGVSNCDFDKQCVGEKASRGLLVPVWLCSLAVLGFFVWESHRACEQVVFGKKVVRHGEIDPYFGDEEDMY